MNLLTALLFQLSFVALTISTGVFGATMLMMLYRTHPRGVVYPLQLATVAAAIGIKAPLLALIVLSLNLMVWLYLRLDKKNLYEKAVLAVLLGSGVYLVSLYGWAHFYLHQPFWGWLSQEMNFYVKQSQDILGDIHFDVDLLVYQIPSFVITIFALNLWIAVLIESKVQKKFGALRTEVEMKNFKAPEPLIWVAIFALLFSFVKTPVPGLQEAALNILNLSLLLYFFQGVSVASYLMELLSFGALLKIIVYFIFIAQLLLPICMGILDFWLNFRNKLSKKRL